jgi:hypothetical protein
MRGRLTDDGLVVADGRQLGWDEIYHVAWTADAALAATAAGVVKVSREAGDVIERRIAPWEAERDAWAEAAGEEQRRRWAALPAGDQAVSEQRLGPTLNALSFWIASAFCLGLGLLIDEPLVWYALLPMSVMCAALGAFFWRVLVGPDITRDTQGLIFGWRRPRRVAWSELRACVDSSIKRKGRGDITWLTLLTRRGPFFVKNGYRDGEALRAGLNAAAAERAAAVPAGGRGWFAPSLRRPGQGLWLDDEGLVVVAHHGSRRWPWASLRPPTWVPFGSTLAVGDRTLKLGWYAESQRLAEAIDQRLGGDEELLDDAGELKREVIERWLGVPPGGAMRCGMSRWRSGGCGLVLAALLLASAALAYSRSFSFIQMIQPIIMLLTMLVAMVRSPRSVLADAQGLSVKRGRRRESYAWADILAAELGKQGWCITTRQGQLDLAWQAKGQAKVIGIIKRLLAMRERGAVLPGDAPLPETAISRMAVPLAESVERGLTVSREEGDHDRPSL